MLLEREWGRRHWLPIVFRRTMQLGTIGPVVSFTFDDFPRSAYTIGGKILENFAARGTFYTAFGLANTNNHCGDQFGLDDLAKLVDDKHELASHTFHHVSSRRTSVRAFVDDVLKGRAAIHNLPGITATDNFAYPFGAVTARAKRAVGEKMSSCRSIFRGINGPIVDLNLLRANPLYGDVDSLGCVRDLLQENSERRGWLIFYTHDVQKSPSHYGCTPGLMELAVKLTVDSSTKILTVNEVLALARQKSQAGPVTRVPSR
jgi:peptidoglycan/xylan/chitin deacetylase (PgdA/CDA1 family)